MFQQSVKTGAVIFFVNMTQLMSHNEIDGLFRILHEKTGKTKTVFSAATAVSLPGSGDFNSCWSNTHLLAPVCHLFRNDFSGGFLQSGNLFGRRRGRCGFGSAALLFQMLGDPRTVGFHEGVDLFLGQAQGSPD